MGELFFIDLISSNEFRINLELTLNKLIKLEKLLVNGGKAVINNYYLKVEEEYLLCFEDKKYSGTNYKFCKKEVLKQIDKYNKA